MHGLRLSLKTPDDYVYSPLLLVAIFVQLPGCVYFFIRVEVTGA